MRKIILFSYYNFLLKDIYNRSLKQNGFTPMGVCWRDRKSQYIRFKILTDLLKRFSDNEKMKVADIGCGYAELLNYFIEMKKKYLYEGYDINRKMINFCNERFNDFKFYLNDYPKNFCNVSVISGTYNYAVTQDIESWEQYLLYNLSRCYVNSNLGLVLNLQFKKKRMIINNIYYTEISYMLSLLKRKFTRVEKYYSFNSSNDIYFIIYKN